MKNKKGFTLTELIAVIAVLAIIILIAVPIYNSVRKNVDDKNFDNKKKKIEIAASKYSEDTKVEYLFVKELVDYGYLDSDDKSGKVYGKNGEDISCWVVQSIYQTGGIYSSKLINNSSLMTSDKKSCDIEKLNEKYGEFYIDVITADGQKASKGWTNKNLVLVPTFKENAMPAGTVTYSWYKSLAVGGNVISRDKNLPIIISEQGLNVYNSQYSVMATLEDGTFKVARIALSIDQNPPRFNDGDVIKSGKINGSGNSIEWKNKYIYTPSTYDGDSKLRGHVMLKLSGEFDEAECPTDGDSYAKNFKYTFGEENGNGWYKVCAMDNAGNITSQKAEIKSIDSTKLDNSFRVDESLSQKGQKVGKIQWYIGDRLTLINESTTIGPSGITLSIYDKKTSDSTEQSFEKGQTAVIRREINSNQNGTVYVGKVENKAKSKKERELAVYYEKGFVPPIYIENSKKEESSKVSANFTETIAISGIKTKTCYYGTNSNNINIKASVSGNTCTYENSSYTGKTGYLKMCATSKAGNTECSSPVEVKMVGICTDSDKTEGKEILVEKGNCGSCGTASVTDTYKVEIVSKSSGKVCGYKENIKKTRNCEHPDCCSSITTTRTEESVIYVHADKYPINGDLPQCRIAQCASYYKVSAYDNSVKCGGGKVKIYRTNNPSVGQEFDVSVAKCKNDNGKTELVRILDSIRDNNSIFSDSQGFDDSQRWHSKYYAQNGMSIVTDETNYYVHGGILYDFFASPQGHEAHS